MKKAAGQERFRCCERWAGGKTLAANVGRVELRDTRQANPQYLCSRRAVCRGAPHGLHSAGIGAIDTGGCHVDLST